MLFITEKQLKKLLDDKWDEGKTFADGSLVEKNKNLWASWNIADEKIKKLEKENSELKLRIRNQEDADKLLESVETISEMFSKRGYQIILRLQ